MQEEFINIRSKPTKIPEAPSSELIEEDLRSAVIQMDSIENLQTTKYNVKDPPPRSPAPLPEAVSPAGVPIDISSPELRDICDSPKSKSPSSRGEFKIDFSSIEAMEEVDLTLDGKKPGEYRRNMKGSLIIAAMFLVGIHLFLNHCTMFSWVLNYDSPELVVATVLYFISSICILSLFLVALIVPSLSICEEKFPIYYGTVLVAGGLDLIAVWIAGGIFSPLVIYTLDSMNYLWYNRFAALLTILINGGLYYGLTRRQEDGKIFSFFHPFKRIENENENEEIKNENISEIKIV